jgi:nucleoside-diphosphate-sugar epimerase
MSTYVVTGCAGFIGSHLVDSLLADGHRVRGVDAFTDYYPRSVKNQNLAAAGRSPLFDLVEADLAEYPLDALLKGAAGVFHLAGQPGVRGSWDDSFASYVRRNIVASQRVAAAAARSRVRLVLGSTSSVYGEAESYPTSEDAAPRPISGYGVTKLASEHVICAHASALGLPAVVLRYFSVYGPRQRPDMAFARIALSLRTGTPFEVFGSGEQTRDFTYVADAVDATRTAMERARPGAVFNVGGGEIVSLNEAIALCERLAGRRLEVRYRDLGHDEVSRTSANTGRIRAELAWRPRTPLPDGLAAQLRSVGIDVVSASSAASHGSTTGR